jgi:hypothetical protein
MHNLTSCTETIVDYLTSSNTLIKHLSTNEYQAFTFNQSPQVFSLSSPIETKVKLTY